MASIPKVLIYKHTYQNIHVLIITNKSVNFYCITVSAHSIYFISHLNTTLHDTWPLYHLLRVTETVKQSMTTMHWQSLLLNGRSNWSTSVFPKSSSATLSKPETQLKN